MPKLFTLALLTVAACCLAQDKLPEPKQADLLTDFTKDIAADESNATISLLLKDIRPLRNNQTGQVTVQLQWRGGKFAEKGHRASADYNQVSSNKVEVREAAFEKDKIAGKLAITIGPDSPRPGVKGFPNPADEYEVEFTAAVDRSAVLPYQDDTDSFMPPWRKDNYKFGGTLITGTYKAKLNATKDQALEGKLVGAISPAIVPGTWGAEGNITVGRTLLSGAPASGAAVVARLAPRRVAAPEGARLIKEFAAPADWRKYDGLRITVSSPKRRDDAHVAIGIREGEGAWYGVTGAAMLLGKEAAFTVPFADFRRTGGFDANYFLDLDKVAAISIGVDNPMGVGDIEFVVRKIELVRWTEEGSAAAPAPVTVKVDPSVNLLLDGIGEIPKGLFGFHAVNMPKTLDAPADGKPAPLDYVKQLNPGYFRPLDHVGWGGKNPTDEQIKAAQEARVKAKTKPTSVFYQMAEAANAVDNIVWCHTVGLWSRPPWMEGDRAKFLENIRLFYRDRGADAWVPGDDYNLLRRLEVWNEPFMWGRWINMGRFLPPSATDWKDPTQFGYIPAKVGTEAYCDIFDAAYAGAKSANKHVQLGGPSAPAYISDDYSNFEYHVKPFIDRCHDKIDFLTEHHYQGEPDSYAAGNLVAGAYADVKYGKRLATWNTECNDLADTPTKGTDGEAPAWSLKADEMNKAFYNMLDILACAREAPDTSPARAMHALWSGYCKSQGETDAYTILSKLRGKTIAVESTSPAIVTCATAPGDGTLVTFMLNNSPVEQTVTFVEPQGFKKIDVKQLIFDNGTKLIDNVREVDAAKRPAGVLVLAIAPRSAVRFIHKMDDYAPAQTRTFETSFADCPLARVAADKPTGGKIIWRGKGPQGAKAAALRLVTRGVDRGEAVAIINGATIPLPWSSSNDACAIVQDVKIDPAILKPETTIEFRCADPANANGFTVWAAGVRVER